MDDKLTKKVKRKMAQVLSRLPEWDIQFSTEPTTTIFIGNAGIQTGVDEILLKQLLDIEGIPVTLYIPREQDFTFAVYQQLSDSIYLYEHFNGSCLQELILERQLHSLCIPSLLNGPPLHLYMSYVIDIPKQVFLTCQTGLLSNIISLPPGMSLLLEFITEREEEELFHYFTEQLEHEESIDNKKMDYRTGNDSCHCLSECKVDNSIINNIDTSELTNTVPILTESTNAISITTESTNTVSIANESTNTVPILSASTNTAPVLTESTKTISIATKSTNTALMLNDVTTIVPILTESTTIVPILNESTNTVSIATESTNTVPIANESANTTSIFTESTNRGSILSNTTITHSDTYYTASTYNLLTDALSSNTSPTITITTSNPLQETSTTSYSALSSVTSLQTSQSAITIMSPSSMHNKSVDSTELTSQPQFLSAHLKLRSVCHYGYEFLYGLNTIDPSQPLPGGLPDICDPILKRMIVNGLTEDIPDQLTVNIYKPGAGNIEHILLNDK